VGTGLDVAILKPLCSTRDIKKPAFEGSISTQQVKLHAWDSVQPHSTLVLPWHLHNVGIPSLLVNWNMGAQGCYFSLSESPGAIAGLSR
jgi:hypothetical protein